MYLETDGGARLAEKHAELLAALSNPARLQMLDALRSREINVAELCSVCGLSQSAVSQHLNRLRTAGLVKTRKQNQMVFYRLTSDEANMVLATLLDLSPREDD